MCYKNIAMFVLILLSVVLGRAIAVLETQEQTATNENQPSPFGATNLGSLSSSSSSKLLSETAVPGKSSRYIIRFARTPSSMIRFSRSPSSQIRFGRSQPFVRFGRSNEQADEFANQRANSQFVGPEKYTRFNKMTEYYDDGNIRIEPRSASDSGFIRFGRSQGFATPLKPDSLRAINWRNFLRLGRNTNANIRFAGKRDGSSTNMHHNAVPIEMLLEKFAQQKQSQHPSTQNDQDEQTMTTDDEQLDSIDTNSDQYQTVYSNGNELEQN